MDDVLMSVRYTKSKSWAKERGMQVRQRDKAAYTNCISKHEGMRQVVEHLQQQLPPPTFLQSAPAPAVKQAEQAALQALDQLQVTLGRVLKLKGKLTVSKTVCGLGAVWSLHEALDKWVPPAGGGNGGLSGRPLDAKGPNELVPETQDLTMRQMVLATMEAGLCPVRPLN